MEEQDKMLREMLQEPEIPEQLKPEYMKKRLDLQKSAVKVKRNRKIQWIAGLTACAVLCGGSGIYLARQSVNDLIAEIHVESDSAKSHSVKPKKNNKKYSGMSYMEGAENYAMVYACLSEQAENLKYAVDGVDEIYYEESSVVESAEEYLETGNGDVSSDSDAGSKSYSDTYHQETGVLEGDIIKTDGACIYSVNTADYDLNLQVAKVEAGTFTEHTTLNLEDEIPELFSGGYGSIQSLYVLENRLVVIADFTPEVAAYAGVSDGCCIDYAVAPDMTTCVAVFESGIQPTLIGYYTQSGSMQDVRLMEDGSLYLITDDYTAAYWEDADPDQPETFVPSYTENETVCYPNPEQILLPNLEQEEACDFYDMSYTNIGSLNVLSDTPWESVDFKTLSCFSGMLYCSNNNLYLTSGWEKTEITRIAIANGRITPEAQGSVDGSVLNQFSMSEYNGFFRIAVTGTELIETTETFEDSEVASAQWQNTGNSLYILDMNLEQVGCLSGFGEDETIQSVNFQGDLAYVVTFRQTDPLFAIDLQNPENPVMLDDYKINGYSTYMQKWSDALLLGFGVDADDFGTQTGLKLVMFDTSNPTQLQEAGIVTIHSNHLEVPNGYYGESYVYSNALNERKALFIAPEKNVIGFPVNESWWMNSSAYDNYQYGNNYSYVFYSYDNGTFTALGSVQSDFDFTRAIYIGDYIYVLATGEMVSVDMETMEQVDLLQFS